MEYFSVEGSWWVPERDTQAIPGTFTFDSGGLTLLLRGGSLEPSSASFGEPFAMPFIHGRTHDGQDVSLLNADGLALGAHGTVKEADYRADLALLGCHASSDAFVQAETEFDYLDAWAAPPSIREDSGRNDLITVRPGLTELASAAVDGDNIQLISRVFGRWSDASVHLERSCAFSVDCAQPKQLQEILNLRIRPLHDLLTFTLGRPVRMTRFRLKLGDAGGAAAKMCDAYFSALQPAKSSGIRAVKGANAPTLLTAASAPMNLTSLLERWFILWDEEQEELALLLAPDYAPFMYSVHKFLCAFQCAESLAKSKKRCGSRDLDKSVYKARKRAVEEAVAGLDNETVAWVNRRLEGNNKLLKDLIEEFVRSTGAVGNAVFEAAPDFATTVARARGGISHGGSRAEAAAPVDLHWLGEVLRWVIRARLLRELALTDIEHRVLEREPFRFALEQTKMAPA
ncbi:HEPN domain-containing protein [Streptomyces sp. NPDC048342]|uniref:ApeA N-terminal domain 1-containing protein n=1 Tax=unclassified Streptomyces TaxID=2593676 RepID=UPI00342BD559